MGRNTTWKVSYLETGSSFAPDKHLKLQFSINVTQLSLFYIYINIGDMYLTFCSYKVEIVLVTKLEFCTFIKINNACFNRGYSLHYNKRCRINLSSTAH